VSLVRVQFRNEQSTATDRQEQTDMTTADRYVTSDDQQTYRPS